MKTHGPRLAPPGIPIALAPSISLSPRWPSRIPREHIAFIRRISRDHPEWGEHKIAEEFDAKFGIHHSASTIRRYMVRRIDGPRKTQT